MKQVKKLGLLLLLTITMMTACTTKNNETENVNDTKETNIRETNKETIKETTRDTTTKDTTDHTNDGVIGEIGEDVIDGVETIGEDIKEGIQNTETENRETR
ncbi:MAG TPA: hypothetical protein H9887_09280 [Candidatus Dorea intestinavium]|nr:hypothetical protein [Candidatus Dorea intestinavium]